MVDRACDHIGTVVNQSYGSIFLEGCGMDARDHDMRHSDRVGDRRTHPVNLGDAALHTVRLTDRRVVVRDEKPRRSLLDALRVGPVSQAEWELYAPTMQQFKITIRELRRSGYLIREQKTDRRIILTLVGSPMI
jgi:hypothetical protein